MTSKLKLLGLHQELSALSPLPTDFRFRRFRRARWTYVARHSTSPSPTRRAVVSTITSDTRYRGSTRPPHTRSSIRTLVCSSSSSTWSACSRLRVSGRTCTLVWTRRPPASSRCRSSTATRWSRK